MAAFPVDLKNIRSAVLTVSDSCFSGCRRDESGPALRRMLEAAGAIVFAQDIVSDEKAAISRKLISYAKKFKASLVLSTGGTGVGPRDVTPEATRQVIKMEVLGLAELMRSGGLKKTRRAALSRGVVGVIGQSLVVNLPGNPKAAVESFEAIADLVPHALAMIRGEGH
jgi:molybdopterin adenylyltransferase